MAYVYTLNTGTEKSFYVFDAACCVAVCCSALKCVMDQLLHTAYIHHAHAHAHAYTHAHAYSDANAHAHTHAHECTCAHACTCTRMHTHTCTHTHMHTHMHTHTHAHTRGLAARARSIQSCPAPRFASPAHPPCAPQHVRRRCGRGLSVRPRLPDSRRSQHGAADCGAHE